MAPVQAPRSTLLMLAFALIAAAPHGAERPMAAARELGFALNPNAQGRLYTLFLYTVHEGHVVDARPLEPGTFILQAAGLEESPANLEGIDLFEEHGIAGCSPGADAGRAWLQCPVIDQLWKLRYRGAAVPGQGAGWAGEEWAPSARQQVLLHAYRAADALSWQGPYYGKDAFRLLRDMQDEAWVRFYRDGG
jgi:hypothetical protein